MYNSKPNIARNLPRVATVATCAKWWIHPFSFFFCWKLNISLTLTNIPGNIWVDGTDDEKSEGGGGTELFVCFERQTFRAHLKLLTKRKNNKTCIMAEVHHYSYTWFKLKKKKKREKKIPPLVTWNRYLTSFPVVNDLILQQRPICC